MFRSPLTDALVVIVVLLLIVGPKKLPQMGRGLGDGMREFKEGITGGGKSDEPEQPEQPKVTLQPPPAQPTAPAADTRPAQGAASGHEAGPERSA
jgi:sec-independent protein translocase protein TatA